MPLSRDGRWSAQCTLCGATFQRRRKTQEFCSQKCSNKAFPGVGGAKPTPGLAEQVCEICGTKFQPYRAGQVTCSVVCHRQTDAARESQRRGDNRPERRERQNELRRVNPEGGKSHTAGLAERACEVCGGMFQPYRTTQLTHRECYNRRADRRAAQREYNARPERQARKNEQRRTDPGQVARIREYNRRMNLKSHYGLTVEEYDRMFEAQGGVCAVCGKPADPDGVRSASRLHVDHDHETGRLRELLCIKCNRGLGYFADDPALLRAMAAYIERHRALVAAGE